MTKIDKNLKENVAVAMRAALLRKISQNPTVRRKIEADRVRKREEAGKAITTAGRIGPALAGAAAGAALGGPAGALGGMAAGYFTGKRAFGEEAPVNNVGSGAIAGMGIYPGDKSANWGEPGVSKANQKKHKTRILRRSPPQGLDLKTGHFWGEATLIVPDSKIHETRIQKRKGKWWTSYIGEDEVGLAIREWANAHPDSPVILEGENTGYIVFARYGKHK